jgi:hypothetical protein
VISDTANSSAVQWEVLQVVVEAKVAVDDRILAGRQTKNETGQQNAHSTRRTLARWAFADHMDRLVANKSAPGPKGSHNWGSPNSRVTRGYLTDRSVARRIQFRDI